MADYEAFAPGETADPYPEPAAPIGTPHRIRWAHNDYHAVPLTLAPLADRLIVTIPAGMPAWTVVDESVTPPTRRIIVSVPNAAKLLGVCPRTVYTWLGRGLIEGCYTPTGLRRVYVDTFFRRHQDVAHRDGRGGYLPPVPKRVKAVTAPAQSKESL